jgi:FkbM family methyltransferase
MKYFIDCGYHLGEGLRDFTQRLGINGKDWVVHAFEANPECEIEKKWLNHPFLIRAINKAVWTTDGTTILNLESRSATGSPTEFSTSTLDGWGTTLADVESSHSYVKQIEVPTFDFSQFMKNFVNEKEVYVKMDIEGAEFPVLRKCLVDGTIAYMKEIYVEWHYEDLKTESKETCDSLKAKLSKYTTVIDWH